MFNLQINDNRLLQEWFDDACKDDNQILAERILGVGADVDYMDVDESYPLSRACAAGNVSLVQFLLAHGADINRTCLALSEACKQEDDSVDILNILLEAGADVSRWPLDDKHPLLLAYASGNLAVTKILLEKYKCPPEPGSCSSICTACNDNLACISIFLLNKSVYVNDQLQATFLRDSADPRVCVVTQCLERYVGNCLCRAVVKWDLNMITAILDGGGDVNSKGNRHDTALLTASKAPCKTGALELFSLLLSRGADANAVHASGRTPLIFACDSISPPPSEVITLLLGHGANLHTTTDSCSPLSCAVHRKHHGLMTRLFLLGAAPDRFALHAAIDLVDIDVLSLLLDRGADVNALCNGGLTPLLRLVSLEPLSRQHVNMTTLLIDRGADVEARDGEGLTALSRLCRMAETASSHLSIIKRLVAKGANADTVDSKGYSALNNLLEASCGYTMIRELLKHDVNTSRYFDDGDTPIIAMMNRSVTNNDVYASALHLLLRRKVDANIPNYITGDTALMVACRRGKVALFELLLRYGADVTAVNHAGESVADIIGNSTHLVQLHALCAQYVDRNVPKHVLK